MSFVYADRVQETFTTTGTGTISLGGALTGYQAFSAALSTGQTCYYEATDGTNWETGFGTYTTSGNTLARTTISSSSNAGSAVSWAAGTKNIWLDLPAAALPTAAGVTGTGQMVLANSPTFTGTVAAPLYNATTTGTGYELGGSSILYYPDTDTSSIAVGLSALASQSNASGASNTGVGNRAGQYISSGFGNTAVGGASMQGIVSALTTGVGNSSLGTSSLTAVQGSASYNTAFGYDSGGNITTGNNNALFGANTSTSGATDTNSIVVGYGLTGGGSNTVNLGGILTATGIGTPSTSTVTIPGALTVTGIVSSAVGSSSGNVVTVGGTQTLTNKTIAYASNTLTGVAPIASPTFTGTPALAAATATTPARGDFSTNVATTAFHTQNIPGGNVNVFRNASMVVAQRGISGTITAGAPAYTLDGWIVGCTGANTTWARLNGYSAIDTQWPQTIQIVGLTSVTDTYLKQRIESSISCYLANKQVTIQFIVLNNTGATITPTLTVNHANSLDNFSAVTADLAATNLQSIGNGNAATVSYTYTASNSSYLGLEVILDFGSVLNSNTKNVVVGGADMRITPGATTGLNSTPPFPEIRPISVEMAANQRYYTTSYGNGTAAGASTHNGIAFVGTSSAATVYGGATVYFPVQMRVAPSISYWDGAGNSSKLSYLSNTSWTDNTTPTNSNVALAIGSTSFLNSLDVTATPLAPWFIHYTATAEL